VPDPLRNNKKGSNKYVGMQVMPVDKTTAVDCTKARKEFIIVDILRNDDIDYLLVAASKSVAVSSMKFTLTLHPEDRHALIIALENKETGALVSPITGFRLNPEESAIMDEMGKNGEKATSKIVLKAEGFRVYIARNDEIEALIDSIEEAGSNDCIREIKEGDTMHFFKALIRDEAEKEERNTSQYMI